MLIIFNSIVLASWFLVFNFYSTIRIPCTLAVILGRFKIYYLNTKMLFKEAHCNQMLHEYLQNVFIVRGQTEHVSC